MKSLREQLTDALAEAKGIADAAKDREFTADEQKRVVEIKSAVDDLQKEIKAADDAKAAVIALQKSAIEGVAEQKGISLPDPNSQHLITESKMMSKTLGQAFVKSASYQGFRKSYPSGIGKDTPIRIAAEHLGYTGQKADPNPLNTIDNANLLPTWLPGIDDLTYRQPTTILDLITKGSASSPLLQYRQLISIDAAAGITAESKTTTGTDKTGGLKPLSTLKTQTKNAAAYTYADGIEITNQELSDDGALAALIDGILRQNLMIEMERVILEGAGTDDEPAGIMNTTGVLHQAYDTDILTTIRKAQTLLRTTSLTTSQAIVLNPEDDETFDLMKDTQGRYYGNGPWNVGPQAIWSMPRVVSTRVPVGTAIMGDFSQVQMLNLEPTTVLAFNQHKDYAQRNLVYVRAECRCLQLVRQPAKLAILTLKQA